MLEEKEKKISELEEQDRQHNLALKQLGEDLYVKYNVICLHFTNSLRTKSEERADALQQSLNTKIEELKLQLERTEADLRAVRASNGRLLAEAANFDKKLDEVTHKYQDQLRETVRTFDQIALISKQRDELEGELRGTIMQYPSNYLRL